MTVLRYFILMLIATVFCLGAFVLVLFFINPITSGWIGIACFYLSLFFSITGTLSLVGFGVRILFWKNVMPYKHVGISLRQGLLFAVLVALSMVLAANNLFTWWSIILLIAGLGLLELFFLSRSITKFNKKI